MITQRVSPVCISYPPGLGHWIQKIMDKESHDEQLQSISLGALY